MFQYTSTNIINSANQFEVVKKGENTTVLVRMNYGPGFKVSDKDNICVYKAQYKDETPDKVTIDIASICNDASGEYRLNIYMRSVGNADPTFANDFVFKGKPFYVEFKGNDPKKIVEVAKKFMLAVYDQPQMKFSVESNKLVIEGVNGYQRFFYVAIEEWSQDTNDCCKVDSGAYEVLSSTDSAEYEEQEDKTLKLTSEDGHIEIVRGNEGQGTYEQIIKDLRLPTGDNFAYLNANALQMPAIGGKYTQFTVRLNKELEGYPGGIGINNPVSSITTHVFFVIDSVVEDFEAAINLIAKDDEAEVVPAGDTSDLDVEDVEP